MVVAYYLSKDSEISKYIKYLNLVFLRKKKMANFTKYQYWYQS